MILTTDPPEVYDAWGPCPRTGSLQTQSHSPGHLPWRICHDSSRRIYSASTSWWSRMFPVQCLIGRERWVMPALAALGNLMPTEDWEFDHTGRMLSHILLLLWASRGHLPMCTPASVTFVVISWSACLFFPLLECVPLGQRPDLRHSLRSIFSTQLNCNRCS